jgi:hypothetical protein
MTQISISVIRILSLEVSAVKHFMFLSEKRASKSAPEYLSAPETHPLRHIHTLSEGCPNGLLNLL